ncbi:MAG: dual OB domain-containing protein [Treponema sp.]
MCCFGIIIKAWWKVHCLKDFDSKKWFRLVSDANGSAVPYEKAVFLNDYGGPYPLIPLKVVSIPIDKKSPILGQPENIILGDGLINQVDPFVVNDISDFIDSPNDLWSDGESISDSNVSNITQSLYLIKPETAKLKKETKTIDGKLKRYVSFRYNMIEYKLPCTDPKFDSLLKEINFTVQALCISLGENFNGYHYKIVATIL